MDLTSKIREKIIVPGIDDRYKIDAYEFVFNGIDFYQSKLGEKRHVCGQELSIGILLFAHKQFGLMAKSVLCHWGIKATGDLGCIVYNMIKVGMLSKRPNETMDDFYEVIDIGVFFDGMVKECFSVDKEFVRKLKS